MSGNTTDIYGPINNTGRLDSLSTTNSQFPSTTTLTLAVTIPTVVIVGGLLAAIICLLRCKKRKETQRNGVPSNTFTNAAYDDIESGNAYEGPRCHTVYRESEKYFNSVLSHDLEDAGWQSSHNGVDIHSLELTEQITPGVYVCSAKYVEDSDAKMVAIANTEIQHPDHTSENTNAEVKDDDNIYPDDRVVYGGTLSQHQEWEFEKSDMTPKMLRLDATLELSTASGSMDGKSVLRVHIMIETGDNLSFNEEERAGSPYKFTPDKILYNQEKGSILIKIADADDPDQMSKVKQITSEEIFRSLDRFVSRELEIDTMTPHTIVLCYETEPNENVSQLLLPATLEKTSQHFAKNTSDLQGGATSTRLNTQSFKRESKNQKGRTKAESGYFSGASMIDSPKAGRNEKGFGNGVSSTPSVRNDVEQKMGSEELAHKAGDEGAPETDRPVSNSTSGYNSAGSTFKRQYLSLVETGDEHEEKSRTADYDTQADVHYEPDETETELHHPDMPVETRPTQKSRGLTLSVLQHHNQLVCGERGPPSDRGDSMIAWHPQHNDHKTAEHNTLQRGSQTHESQILKETKSAALPRDSAYYTDSHSAPSETNYQLRTETEYVSDEVYTELCNTLTRKRSKEQNSDTAHGECCEGPILYTKPSSLTDAYTQKVHDIIASYANSDEIGCRFSSKYLCIWIIGPAGGTLSFSGMESFKLEIPAGALCQPKQLVYMYLYKPPIGEENLEHQMSFSPIVDCGPNGLKFQKPVTLTLPHSAKKTSKTLTMMSRQADEASGWTDEGGDIEVTERLISATIRHFTLFGATAVDENSKDFATVAFFKGNMARVYVMPVSSEDAFINLTEYVYKDEERLEYHRSSPPKHFTFNSTQGRLMIRVHRKEDYNSKIADHELTVERMMSMTLYHSIDFSSEENGGITAEITLKQEMQPDNVVLAQLMLQLQGPLTTTNHNQIMQANQPMMLTINPPDGNSAAVESQENMIHLRTPNLSASHSLSSECNQPKPLSLSRPDRGEASAAIQPRPRPRSCIVESLCGFHGQYGRPCNCERLTGKSSGYYSSTSLPGYQIYDIPYEDQENNNTFQIDKNIIGLAIPNTLENEKREESEEELGEQLDINRLSNEVPNLDEESSHD